MIEPTDEMVAVFRDAWMRSMQTDPSTDDPEAVADRAGLAAVLALVERDYCLERKGHVYHPLTKPGRGVNHPHFCLSCSNGETRGPGCINCRQTGFDQTPWPDCRECAS